jgi:nitroreductase
MDLLEIIRQRRSIREYKKKTLPQPEIDKILEAGRWAPSGLNNQPWRFLVIDDKEKKHGLSKFTKYGEIIKDAPLVIVICMDIADSYNRDKDFMAIGACIQNMTLEAYSLGLGTCWLGEILNKKKEVAGYLKLDSDLELMAVLTVGYPDEDITEGCRKALKNLMIKD